MKRIFAWFDSRESAKDYGSQIQLDWGEWDANSVLSLCELEDHHMPILDDDQGIFRIVKSKTPGHQHVYINKPVRADLFARLLEILAECELVDPNWVRFCLEQGTATLRLPHNSDLQATIGSDE